MRSMLGRRDVLDRTVRFGAVGLSATALYFVLGLILRRGGLTIEWASFCAQTLSILYSYIAQKRFTFRLIGRHQRFGPRFVVSTILLVTLAQILVWSLDEFGVRGEAALAANAVFYPVASFLMHTSWTFVERGERRFESDAA